jgi:hypothetical protein
LYLDPRSEWRISASALPRRQAAIIKASITSDAFWSAFTEQLTARGEKRSNTKAW